jgi:tetratricopeptide repeat protein
MAGVSSRTTALMFLAMNGFCLGAAGEDTFRNTTKGAPYVGSKVCAGCHPGVFESYRKTGMGRSMASASSPAELAKSPKPVTLWNEKLNRYFSVYRDGDAIVQSEYELDSSGGEVFRATNRLEFVIGSGTNGTTYLVKRGDSLFEAPLSHYARIGSWGFSPGYEMEDAGFSRPIQTGCLSCHSGRVEPVLNRPGAYKDPPFRELAIGCENCHGPGQLHVNERSRKLPVTGKLDDSIVNPAKLPGWLADNICMNCHQGTATRILQPGKEYLDFRPGTPLDRTVAIFELPVQPGAKVSPLLEHYSMMTMSKCYRESNGRLSCVTCHDPHVQPISESALYFRDKCLGCHSAASCKLAPGARGNDCAGCHMPKQNVTQIAHSVLTDHRIVSRNGQSLPNEAFQRTTEELPDLVHLNRIPGKKDKVPSLTLLRAYGELVASQPQYGRRYVEVLQEAAKTDPDDSAVLSALAWIEVGKNTPESNSKAMDYLGRAIRSGSQLATDFEKRAELLNQAGRAPEAIEVLKRGISVDPHYQRSYKALALLCISEKRYEEAVQAMRQELATFPQDSFMRKLLEKAEAAPRR